MPTAVHEAAAAGQAGLKRISPMDNEPARICSEHRFRRAFHYWCGASGERYLHTVYPLVECPELPRANFILVGRGEDGTRLPIRVGQTREDVVSLNRARLRHLGAVLGAVEVHVHLLAEGREERSAVEADLRAAHTHARRGQNDPLIDEKVAPAV